MRSPPGCSWLYAAVAVPGGPTRGRGHLDPTSDAAAPSKRSVSRTSGHRSTYTPDDPIAASAIYSTCGGSQTGSARGCASAVSTDQGTKGGPAIGIQRSSRSRAPARHPRHRLRRRDPFRCRRFVIQVQLSAFSTTVPCAAYLGGLWSVLVSRRQVQNSWTVPFVSACSPS